MRNIVTTQQSSGFTVIFIPACQTAGRFLEIVDETRYSGYHVHGLWFMVGRSLIFNLNL
jgi:hypothetical protein